MKCVGGNNGDISDLISVMSPYCILKRMLKEQGKPK
jgi:hypothetical protein